MKPDFFTRREGHPLALGSACDSLFGPEWLTWEQRTTRDELNFHGFKVSDMSSQKLAAYKAAKVTIGPWADLEIFENVGLALNSRPPHFGLRQPMSVAECAVAVDMLRMCRVVTFTEDVKKYIASCAALEEIMYLPDPLTFCMPYLCPSYYFCEEHGGVEIDDLVDGQCDLCAGRYEDGKLIDAPLTSLANRGKDIQRFSAYNYAPIANKYEALVILDIDTVRLDMTAVDIQVAKLLDVNSYRKKRKAQLDLQLQEVIDVQAR